MANIYVPDQERRDTANRIMEQYGVDRRDPAMREAAEVVAARQEEAIDKAKATRRYFPCR